MRLNIGTKIFISSCLFIITLQFLSVSFFVLVPAARAENLGQGFDAIPAKINLPFMDLPTEFNTVNAAPCECSDQMREEKGDKYCADYESKTCIEIPWISQYINAVYRYGVVIGSVVAVLSLMAGGLMYVLGGFNQTMLGKGKEMMVGAVMGLILLLGSYMILNLINPNLVRMKPIKVEVNKEMMSAPSSCNDILNDPEYKANIEIEGYTKPSCGTPFKLKLKAGSTVQLGENSTCTGMECENGKACMEKKDAPGKYECVDALVFGKILFSENYIQKVLKMNLGLEAVVDAVSLHESDPLSVDKVMGIPHFDSGTKSYAIKSAGNLEFIQDVNYLKIDVNDKAPGFTIDESYQLGLDQKVTDANKTGVFHAVPVAIEGSDCCTYKCKGEGTWELSPGCNWIDKNYLSTSSPNKWTLNVEINTDTFYCGKTPLGESKSAATGNAYSSSDCFKINGGKKIGDKCGKNEDCSTKDCECEKTDISGGVCFCECNNDDECIKEKGAGSSCNASLATWNYCDQCQPANSDCKVDEECCSHNCHIINNGVGKCECGNDDDCIKHLIPATIEKAEELSKETKAIMKVGCNKNIDPAQCTFCKAVGMDCAGDNDCCSKECASDNKCSCMKPADCTTKEYCNSMLVGHNPCMALKPILALCSKPEECLSNDCEEDQWYGDTNKYGEPHSSAGGTQMRCECNLTTKNLTNPKVTAEGDCGAGLQCIDVEDGCGWNYCIKDGYKMLSVPEGYSSTLDKKLNQWIGWSTTSNKNLDPKAEFPFEDWNYMYTGLCDDKDQCLSNDCNVNWGAKGCNACAD